MIFGFKGFDLLRGATAKAQQKEKGMVGVDHHFLLKDGLFSGIFAVSFTECKKNMWNQGSLLVPGELDSKDIRNWKMRDHGVSP